MALQLLNRGTSPGDGTGDTGYVGAGKINDLINAFNALTASGSGTGYITATLASALTSNWNPGGGFPSGIISIDVNCSVNATVDGLVAGSDLQVLWIYNIPTSVGMLTLQISPSASSAADQFRGPGTALVLMPGMGRMLRYYGASSGVNRWTIF